MSKQEKSKPFDINLEPTCSAVGWINCKHKSEATGNSLHIIDFSISLFQTPNENLVVLMILLGKHLFCQ